MPDGGPTLREQGPAGTVAWDGLLARYARTQHRLAGLADGAARAGVPDMRGRLPLAVLEPAVAAAADPTVHGAHRLTEAESAAVLALAPVLEDVADRLAASPLAPTLEHNDPHRGNVFARSGMLFDWADAVVGHPFLGLANALPHAASDLGVPVGSAEVETLARAYLQHFAEVADLPQLRADAEAAAVLSHLPRAAVWLRMVPAGRRDFPAVLPDRMRALRDATGRWARTARP
ncbi:phosphotransferase [Cellulomonas sp. URHB0016]